MQVEWLKKWNLAEDGDPVRTASSVLQPVRFQNRHAMLKIALVEEERRGNRLMEWWDGHASAQVLRSDETAILMERAANPQALANLAEVDDIEATKILCATAMRLHEAGREPPTFAVPLHRWFRELRTGKTGLEILQKGAVVAESLLADPREVTTLHGDIHHGNVLDFADSGWKAIDPKALIGDRAFDFANILCNPNEAIALRQGRFRDQLGVICRATRIDRHRMASWALAYAALSAAWSLSDGDSPQTALAIAHLALREL